MRTTEYPYFDPAGGGVDWPAMRDAVAAMAPGTVLLLHVCCHNPTGADITAENWRTLAGLIRDRQLVPFLDLAYAGFAEGLETDSTPARLRDEFGIYGVSDGRLCMAALTERTLGRVAAGIRAVI